MGTSAKKGLWEKNVVIIHSLFNSVIQQVFTSGLYVPDGGLCVMEIEIK